jgi:hypothetical protein
MMPRSQRGLVRYESRIARQHNALMNFRSLEESTKRANRPSTALVAEFVIESVESNVTNFAIPQPATGTFRPTLGDIARAINEISIDARRDRALATARVLGV